MKRLLLTTFTVFGLALFADQVVRQVPSSNTRANLANLFQSLQAAKPDQKTRIGGVLSAGFARWTANLGWTGFEWACGVPGTIGGAAAGNAGAYGSSMADCVERVRAWFPGGERVLDGPAMGYAYRTSAFKQSPEPKAILAVDLRLRPGDREAALARIERNEQQRKEKQPTERSCGSVFKNPPGGFSGQLIETAGLKGTTVGGAQISEKHGNFFVNRGQATAADVLALVQIAQRRVEEVAPLLDQFMDTALLLGVGEIKILHGKGEGVLRKVVRERLKKFKAVASMADEHVERGGDGITVVVLK